MRLMILTLLLAVFAFNCNQSPAPSTETDTPAAKVTSAEEPKAETGEEPEADADSEGTETDSEPETTATETSEKTAAPIGVGLDTKLGKNSYVIGINIGQNFAQNDFEVDLDMVLQGMADAISGNKALTEEEIQKTMMDLQKEMMEQQKAKQAKVGEENTQKAAAFLAENKNKDGVFATESGLQYKILKEGSGENPKATSKVKVHYRGTLINGDEFDSSYKRNQPAEFPLNGVIRGWTEGLQLMKPGGKWMFYIPPELGYGPRGQRNIPANSLLIFEVELLEIL